MKDKNLENLTDGITDSEQFFPPSRFVANPERGDRSHFKKLSITMDPVMLATLKMLGAKRQAQGETNTDVSSLIREAVAQFLQRED